MSLNIDDQLTSILCDLKNPIVEDDEYILYAALIKLERIDDALIQKHEVYKIIFELTKEYMFNVYNDHCIDNGFIDIDEYILKYFIENKDYYDAYGGNGCYNIHILNCSKLRDVLDKFSR